MKVGRKAPAFRLQDETGAWVTLESLRGRRVVLFFFPKAGTTGCTQEACEFRDAMPRLRRAGVAVYGISPDGHRKLAKFRAAQELTYPLLSDPDAATCRAYGVWHPKLFWGRYYMGVVRSTFVVGADGTLEAAWVDVPHEGHAEAVAAWLRGGPAPPLAAKSSIATPPAGWAPAR